MKISKEAQQIKIYDFFVNERRKKIKNEKCRTLNFDKCSIFNIPLSI